MILRDGFLSTFIAMSLFINIEVFTFKFVYHKCNYSPQIEVVLLEGFEKKLKCFLFNNKLN